MDLPVPWDTLQLNEVLGGDEWHRINFNFHEHCRTFYRSIDRYSNIERYLNCGGIDYHPQQLERISPSLFFERGIDIPYLRCLVAFEYPRYVTGVLFSMPSDHVLSPPKISIKLFHHDTLIEPLAHDTTPLEPFDKDEFRRLFTELDRYLQDLTGDHSPTQRMRNLRNTSSLPPRGYADLLGQLDYHFSESGCIQASLKCLPVQPFQSYYRHTYGGAWVLDRATDQYWIDTTVTDRDRYKAKYGREWSAEYGYIYDVRWEDLAIYVEILMNRYEGQISGVGDTVGMVPCPRITSLRLPGLSTGE